jgi:uncharacterized protein (DUF305 family)
MEEWAGRTGFAAPRQSQEHFSSSAVVGSVPDARCGWVGAPNSRRRSPLSKRLFGAYHARSNERRRSEGIGVKRPFTHLIAAAFVVAAGNGCSGATAGGSTGQPSPPATAAPAPYPAAVEFITGMIHHHAQAIYMADWSPTHGANQSIRTLSARIAISQKDEIELMQMWLRDNGQPVPDPNPRGMRMMMGGVEHEMLMPGMLTDEQLRQLDQARGAEFDRLFLTFMIQHHQGAIEMVDKVFNSYGGTSDDFVYKFASDVYADQDAEIDRMQRMLAAMAGGG